MTEGRGVVTVEIVTHRLTGRRRYVVRLWPSGLDADGGPLLVLEESVLPSRLIRWLIEVPQWGLSLLYSEEG